jgi:hypothetical protein
VTVKAGRIRILRLVCFLFSMGSGAALLLALITKRALGVILALFGVLALSTYLLVWPRLERHVKVNLKTSAITGALAGVFATLAYDLWRFMLVKFAGFQLNPFEALPLFGYLIAGPQTNRYIALSIGTLYHYLNGITFSIGYSFLLGRRDWRFAIAWALFLEAVMFTVYPGWIDLGAVRKEFTIVSLSGHIVYGVILGLMVNRSRAWLSSKRSRLAMPFD